MHNPLRSEADVFRLVVVIGVAAALVVALSLIAAPVWGVLLAALLIGVGIGMIWRVTRGSEPRNVAATASPTTPAASSSSPTRPPPAASCWRRSATAAAAASAR